MLAVLCAVFTVYPTFQIQIATTFLMRSQFFVDCANIWLVLSTFVVVMWCDVMWHFHFFLEFISAYSHSSTTFRAHSCLRLYLRHVYATMHVNNDDQCIVFFCCCCYFTQKYFVDGLANCVLMDKDKKNFKTTRVKLWESMNFTRLSMRRKNFVYHRHAIYSIALNYVW